MLHKLQSSRVILADLWHQSRGVASASSFTVFSFLRDLAEHGAHVIKVVEGKGLAEVKILLEGKVHGSGEDEREVSRNVVEKVGADGDVHRVLVASNALVDGTARSVKEITCKGIPMCSVVYFFFLLYKSARLV